MNTTKRDQIDVPRVVPRTGATSISIHRFGLSLLTRRFVPPCQRMFQQCPPLSAGSRSRHGWGACQHNVQGVGVPLSDNPLLTADKGSLRPRAKGRIRTNRFRSRSRHVATAHVGQTRAPQITAFVPRPDDDTRRGQVPRSAGRVAACGELGSNGTRPGTLDPGTG